MSSTVSEELNRRFQQIIANSPELSSLFPRMPRYRYFEHRQRRFCWNTGPFGGDRPWRAWEYAPVGPGSRSGKARQWKLVREVKCGTRKAAKATALQWFHAARGTTPPPAVPAANPQVIESEEQDSDGYWIHLRPGWKLPGEDTHSIVEETRAAARRKLAEVVPCTCRECSAPA